VTVDLFRIQNTSKHCSTKPRDNQERTTLEKGQLEAIDLIINVLREHEKTLDNLLDRLDTLIETLSATMARLEYLYERIETPAQ
jgi:hypothetical protein